MAQLLFNGVAVTAPKTFKVSLMDLDSEKSKRNLKGYTHRDRIRAGVRKIECEWGPLTGIEIKTILQQVYDTAITVTFPDPYIGGQNTLSMYAGDKVMPLYDFDSNMWQGLSFNLTEN